MATLRGKNALIVGANGAIAAANAELLARDGASLLLFGRSAERLAGLRDQLLATIGDAEIAVFVGDTSGEADMQAAAKAAFDLKGRLDICVSTVATSITAPVLDLSLSDFLEGMNGSVQSNFCRSATRRR